MRLALPSLHLTLSRHEPVSLEGAAGTHVHITEGCVWLTEEGHPEDVFLVQGDDYVVQSAARIVMESDFESRVIVAEPVAVRGANGRPVESLSGIVRQLAGRLMGSRQNANAVIAA